MLMSGFKSTKIFQDFKNPLCLKVFWKLLISPRIGWCSLGSLPELKPGRRCGLRSIRFWWNGARVFEYANIPIPSLRQPHAWVCLGDTCPSGGDIFALMGPVPELFSTQEACFFCKSSVLSGRQQSVCLCSWLLGGKLISETHSARKDGFSRAVWTDIHLTKSASGREPTLPKHM